MPRAVYQGKNRDWLVSTSEIPHFRITGSDNAAATQDYSRNSESTVLFSSGLLLLREMIVTGVYMD